MECSSTDGWDGIVSRFFRRLPFHSFDGSTVIKMNIRNGKEPDYYKFSNINLHAVGLTPDSQRLLGVGTLQKSPTGLLPDEARPEKRIIVYNIKTDQIENQVPILSDVQDISVVQIPDSDEILALIGCDKTPPQLWELELHAPTGPQLTLRWMIGLYNSRGL